MKTTPFFTALLCMATFHNAFGMDDSLPGAEGGGR